MKTFLSCVWVRWVKKNNNRPVGLFALFLLLALPVAAQTQLYDDGVNSDGTLTIWEYFGSLAASISIPATLDGLPVTSIGPNAFVHDSLLVSVTIPNSVTSITGSAFDDNFSLATVYFLGNAPAIVGSSGFPPWTTLYYLPGTTGWGPTLGAQPTTLLAPPAITLEPQSQTVNPAENATFTVAATSAAPLSYQWLLNGAVIDGATEDSYTNLQPAESGSYSVVVSNFAGSVTSAAAVLTVQVTNAATVTITSGLTANDKIYDDTPSATLSSNNVVLAGVVAADAGSVALSTNGYTAAFATSAVGSAQSVSVSGLSLTGSAAANYSLIQPILTANITRAPATIASGLTANNKVYDGTTTATLSSNNVALAGILAAEAGHVALSTNGYTAAFASAGPGTSISVTVSGLSLTGSAAGNYSLVQPSLAANIAPPVGTANPLLFSAGTSSGAQFSQALVPIHVDLFTNVLSFQFSLHWDPTVATYVDVEQFGLPGLGAGSFGTTLTGSGTLTVSWDNPAGSGESLGDGTAVFAVRFTLTGSGGASSAVTMDGTPTALQVANSDLTLVPVQTVSGQLSVAVAPTVVIGGQVIYYPTNYPPSGPSEQAVAGVTVNLTGAAGLNQVTATDGSYSFPGLAPGLDYEVSPAKPDDEPPANGVSTLGIALIRRQILDLAPLGSPYALLAADVDASGTVDTLDIAWIRRLILAVTNTFPAGLWRFVPADYLFPDPSNPWGAPSSRWYTNLLADAAGQDYVAIKLGDVNHSWASPETKPEIEKAESRNLAPQGGLGNGTGPGATANQQVSAVRFAARGQAARPGERVAVQVSVGGFTGGTTAQFTLGWDAGVLRYAGVGEFGVRGLAEDNFGAGLAESGKLTFSWDDPAGTGLEAADGGPMFTVFFDAIGARGSVSPVAFEDWPTAREATVDLVPRALASWDGRVIVVGKRPGFSYGGEPVQGAFRISVPSVTGRQYILEFNDSRSGGNWQGLDAVAGDGSVKTLADPTATTQPRLYRLRVE